MRKSLIFFIIPFLLYSCSIKKRHYLPGYHIEWKNRSQEVREFQKNEYEVKISREEPAKAKEPIRIFNEPVSGLIITDEANETIEPVYEKEARVIIQGNTQEFKSEGKKQKQLAKKEIRVDINPGEIVIKTLCVLLALFGIGWLAIIICGGGSRELLTFLGLCAVAFVLAISSIFITAATFTVITTLIVFAVVFYIASIIFAIGIVLRSRFD